MMMMLMMVSVRVMMVEQVASVAATAAAALSAAGAAWVVQLRVRVMMASAGVVLQMFLLLVEHMLWKVMVGQPRDVASRDLGVGVKVRVIGWEYSGCISGDVNCCIQGNVAKESSFALTVI
ncbi:unnamed protein product, partial [Meganyctiphanes norvegica]